MSDDVWVLSGFLLSHQAQDSRVSNGPVEISNRDAFSNVESAVLELLVVALKELKALLVNLFGEGTLVDSGTVWAEAHACEHIEIMLDGAADLEARIDGALLSEVTFIVAWAVSLHADVADDGYYTLNLNITVDEADSTNVATALLLAVLNR